MSQVQQFFRSIKRPFFAKKKFILWYLVVVLVVLIPCVIWTYFNYEEAVASGKPLRWKKITDPIALPGCIVLLYFVLAAMWLAIQVGRWKHVVLNSAVDIQLPQNVTLNKGEEKFAEVDVTMRKSPNEIDSWGVFRVTNQRLMHTQTRSIKRFAVIFGMSEPDLTWSMPWRNIRQCGFGLDEKNPIRFVVIENNGTIHTFVSVYARHIEKVMEVLRWKRMQVGEQIYWIQ